MTAKASFMISTASTAEPPVAGNGLIASHQEVWDDQGRLLASGISHLLCRPIR